MKKFIFVISLLYVGVVVGQQPLSLEEAIAIGLNKSIPSKIAEKQIEIAENNNIKANTGTSPSLSLNASIPFSFNKTFGDRFFTFGVVPGDSRLNYNETEQVSIDGTWPIYTGGRGSLIKEQLDLAVDQSKISLDGEQQRTVLEIIQSYYSIVLQQEQLEVLNELIKLSRDRIEFEAVKKEFGTSNGFNIIQLEDALLNDSISIVNQNMQIDLAMRSLLDVMNESGDVNQYVVIDKLEFVPEVLDRERLLTVLLANNNDLSVLELNKKLAEANTKLQSAQRKPTISANGSFGLNRNASGFLGTNPMTGIDLPLSITRGYGLNLGVTASYNLIDGGLVKSNIANAKLEQEIANLSYEDVKTDLEIQLLNLIDTYNTNINLLDITEEKLVLAKENIKIAEERFKSGAINSFDYRNIQLTLLNTSFTRLSILYDLIVTKSNIDWLTGEYNQIN